MHPARICLFFWGVTDEWYGMRHFKAKTRNRVGIDGFWPSATNRFHEN
jgi:hypothetical protein